MITARDEEVLRTICRLKLVRVQNVLGTLFDNLRSAQRRFAVLRDAGWIQSHRRGVPIHGGPNGPAYYRLTRSGMERVLERFPDEAHLAGSLEKALGRSLRHPEHHEALVALYLEVVSADDLGEFRDRAARLRYWGDGDIRIEVRSPLVHADVFPDSVLEPVDTGDRVFVELDRSSNSHKRIVEGVEKYAAGARRKALESPFDEERTARLLYVTKTRQRADGLRLKIRALSLGALSVVVLPFDAAVEWLRAALFESATSSLDEESSPPPCCAHTAALLRRLHAESQGLIDVLRREGRAPLGLPAHAEATAFLTEQKRTAHGH